MSLDATLATWDLPKRIVNAREKLFLLSIARRCGENNVCWPSIARIAEDTGLDRKTIVTVRQSLIDKQFIQYTGRMAGRSQQIPEMELLYVTQWKMNKTSKVADNLSTGPVDNPVYNPVDKYLTSTENGTGTSTENGTGTSTENGTLNRSVEYLKGKKSFCAYAPKKSKPSPQPSIPLRPPWADKKDIVAASKPQMDREAAHIARNEVFKRTPPPPMLMDMIKKLKYDLVVNQ